MVFGKLKCIGTQQSARQIGSTQYVLALLINYGSCYREEMRVRPCGPLQLPLPFPSSQAIC